MHNIKRPELFRVTFKFSTSLLLVSTAVITFNYISVFFFAFGPSSGLVTVVLVGARLIFENASSDIITLKHCLEYVFSVEVDECPSVK